MFTYKKTRISGIYRYFFHCKILFEVGYFLTYRAQQYNRVFIVAYSHLTIQISDYSLLADLGG